METIAWLDKAGPSELKLKNVIEDRDARKDEIIQIKEVNKDILNKYLVNPIRLTTSNNSYVKRIEKEMNKEVFMILCEGEMQLDKM
jgi:hypothetical protein